MRISGLYLHPWRALSSEFAYVANYTERQAEIEAKKESAASVAWRKRFFGGPVKSKLPLEVAEKVADCGRALMSCEQVRAAYQAGMEARTIYWQAEAAWVRAWAAWMRAQEELNAALVANAPAMKAIHDRECVRDCPYSKLPGRELGTIFKGYQTYAEMIEREAR